MFNIKNYKRSLIDAKKKDFEYNTHDFTIMKGEILLKNSSKPIIAIFIGIIFLFIRIIFEKWSIPWLGLTFFSMMFCIRGLYFLAKIHFLEKEFSIDSPTNQYTLNTLFNKAKASKNDDFLSAIIKVKYFPTDIKVQALLEYAEEKCWI